VANQSGELRGGSGNLSAAALAKVEAHQLFGEQLPKLLACPAIALKRRRNELNEVLAA
jgi:regulator of protease activity HflC (stomatin/prohibitin superfamily)